MSQQADPTDDADDCERPGITVFVTGAANRLAKSIREAALWALKSEGVNRGPLEIAVVSEAEMRRQHRRWLGNPSITDVLSFDLRENDEAGAVDGQLIVCQSLARRRARERGCDWRPELMLYVVHGCLHLCGYNDSDSIEAARMHEQEDKILTGLGWGPVFDAPRFGKRAAGSRKVSGGDH